MLDWRQVERFQLAKEHIPADTIVLYREVPVWVRYRWYLIFGGLVIVLQLILIFKLAIEGKKSVGEVGARVSRPLDSCTGGRAVAHRRGAA